MDAVYKFNGLSAIETEAILGSSKRQGVFVPAVLVRRLKGDAGAAMILAQLFWWVHNTADDDGWFYKTGDKMTEETGLGRRAQDRAIRRLTELGLLEKKLAGLPAKRWFRVNLARYLELINEQPSLSPSVQTVLSPSEQAVLSSSVQQIETETETVNKRNTSSEKIQTSEELNAELNTLGLGKEPPDTSSIEVGSWRDNMKPWSNWGDTHVHPRGEVSADSLRKLGYGIEAVTKMYPLDDEWSGWLKGLSEFYRAGNGDWKRLRKAIDMWPTIENPIMRPTHPRGFVKLVRKVTEEKPRHVLGSMAQPEARTSQAQ